METRQLMLLAPVYPDVCVAPGSTAVELQRTNDDWLKLVFTTPEGPVEREAACINSHGGFCRCDYVRLLRALMVLAEREILDVTGQYVVATTSDNHSVATLELNVKVHRDANIGESLRDFQLVLCHLQNEALAIARRSDKSRKEAKSAELLDAIRSSCHVVGCRLHLWEADAVYGPKRTLHLPDVFQSLMTHMEAEQLELRDDATFAQRTRNSGQQRLQITDLPTNALHIVVCLLNAKELTSLSGVCSIFRHVAYKVVPGLNLELYEHQRKGLKWMLYRETPSIINRSKLHPFNFARQPERKAKVAIDLLDLKVVEQVDATVRDTCGGMFCDEPGLGKTITMLALILRTKGQFSRNARAREDIVAEISLDTAIRSARSRDRSLPAEDLVSSGASLIIVPDPLVEHWKYQIEVHVAPGALKTFIDEGTEDLPSNSALAACDVVVTSFSRLAKEWKLHRPASALEKSMPERYGFEGPQRYTDGTIRGDISSLLTVHWVRVIVDEGHKLGGQTPTNLMRMARIISAERRWVMTGTPTPNTLQSADLRFMHGLLVFLRNKPFGQPDGRAWTKAIARPFEQNQPVGFYRLQSLLSRIMMRHTKKSIREILPEPIRHTVYIDPTPSEYAQYNVVAAAVRANLVITNMDPREPGKSHLDSLLNPINRKEALQVVTNLRFACCGGVNSEVVLSDKARLETINMLTELEVNGDDIATVVEYLRRVKLPGMTTKCGSCKRKLQLLMILPCGHLCCADCIEDRCTKVGPSCFLCKEVFNPEVFQELQPGFDFREVDDANDENRNGSNRGGGQSRRGQQQQLGHLSSQVSGERSQTGNRPRQSAAAQGTVQGQPRPNRHYWTVDASKIFYAATRVRELKKEFVHRNIAQAAGQRKRARYVKVIIFSQFTEIIWRTKLAFEQQKIPTANFITRVAPKARMKALKRFRTDPSLNVLLLSEMGSHGLDLSFVTHVFLMEEIWDKSLEQQVISRAHRMGANQAVVVEQLWMRGSVESQMANVNELDEDDAVPPREIHDLGLPVRSRKRRHASGHALLNVAGKKKRKRNRRGGATKVPTGNKSSFLQRKLDYVLNHLRLLDESVAAEPQQVRFSVVDESTGTTIRQATHMVRSPESLVVTSSSSVLQPSNSTRPGPQRTQNNAANLNVTTAPQAARLANSNRPSENSVTRHTLASAVPVHRVGPPTTLTTRVEATDRSSNTRNHHQGSQVAPLVAPPTGATANHRAGITLLANLRGPDTVGSGHTPVDTTEAALPTPAITTSTRPSHSNTVKPAVQRAPDSQDIIEIEDDPQLVQPQAQSSNHSVTKEKPSNSPEIIKIDSSSSLESEDSSSSDSSDSGGSADNEAHFGSDDSDDDSDESDGETEALFSQLFHVAQRHFARRREPSRFDQAEASITSSTSMLPENVAPIPEIDDEETETE